jgi:hypothetical protein
MDGCLTVGPSVIRVHYKLGIISTPSIPFKGLNTCFITTKVE